ncbi:MAG: HD domain-containing protein [Actinobacteria bacterium]|nr:HD domain-containing protein [Actinomycetota bacterium]
MMSLEDNLNRVIVGDDLLNRIMDVIRPPGEAVYYVCGAYVLESIRSMEPGGILLVCKNNPAEVAKSLGDSFSVKPVKVTWNNDVYHLYPEGKSSRGITLMRMNGRNITEHLAGSGFTVLSMAADLGSAAPMKLIDPYMGLKDLESKKLRVSSEGAAAGIPDRSLTAVGLCASYGLTPDPRALDELKKASRGLVEVPPGRVFRRLLRTFEGGGLSRKARIMRETGIIGSVIPELAAIYDVPQNYYHHLGVWDHTMKTLDNLEEIMNNLPGSFPANGREMEAYLSRGVEGGFTRRAYLSFMGLLHDIGKAVSIDVLPSGRIRFQGHQNEGAKLAGGIAERFEVGKRGRRYMVEFSRNHMKLGFLAKKNESTLSRLAAVREMGDLCVDLCVHSLADRAAARGDAVTEEALSGFTRLTRRVASDYFWSVKRERLIDGNDIKVHGGLNEGPETGELLMKVLVCQREGLIENRQQALEYIAPDFKGRMKC